MAERAQEEFMIAATPNPVVVGQNFEGIPHMRVLGGFTQPVQWEEFQERIVTLFDRPNAFGSPAYGPNRDTAVRELVDVSPWPYVGMVASVRRHGGIFDNGYAEDFSPYILDTLGHQVQEGELVQFSSLAIVRRNATRTTETDKIGTVEFAVPLRYESTA